MQEYVHQNDVSQLVHLIPDPVRACKERALGDHGVGSQLMCIMLQTFG